MTTYQNKRDEEIVLGALPGDWTTVWKVFRLAHSEGGDWSGPRPGNAMRRLKRAGKVRYVRPNWEKTK